MNRKPKYKSLLPIFFSLALLLCARSEVATAVDWNGCGGDLDDVHDEADNAADAARDAGEAKDDLDSKRDELESCSDDCEDARSEYEEAKSDLEDKINSAKDELSTLESDIQLASAACGYELGSGGASHTTSKRPNPCSVYQRYKNRLPLATILKTCQGSMSEVECKKCLGVGK